QPQGRAPRRRRDARPVGALRKRVQAAEKRIAEAVKRKAALEVRLAEPALYDGPPAQVTALRKDLADAVRAIDEAESAWLAEHEALEAAEAQAGRG
ncbi:MAG: ABC transporter ATP-binding protein, partial [Alphaproteobacteria bacterium]|nr:ABC transporter ATP-binding protein [Alphaproteobacteria bacterium]